ncbi:MAG: hypothetical protein SO170_09610 [Butyribacter sp.]|nr:hypothetical protein [bacterium]MDY3855192.1 hypothetical protein [Butyribacter sp.]
MAKTIGRKMMAKEKSHSIAGKKRSRRGKRVAAWFLAIVMMLTTISLPGNVKQVSAAFYPTMKSQKIDLLTDKQALRKITYTVIPDNVSLGATWYLYVWEKGDTSGDEGRPKILAYTTKSTTYGTSTIELEVDGQEGVTYSFGLCAKNSMWSIETSLSDWPYMKDAFDYRTLSATTPGDTFQVTIDGKEIDVSAETAMENPSEYICYHEWDITKQVEPDCLNDGYTDKKCNKCGETRTFPNGTALGHDWQTISLEEPDWQMVTVLYVIIMLTATRMV